MLLFTHVDDLMLHFVPYCPNLRARHFSCLTDNNLTSLALEVGTFFHLDHTH